MAILFDAMSTTHHKLRDAVRSLCVVRGEVTLASGTKSDYYVDLRRYALTAEGHDVIGKAVFAAVDAAHPRAGAVAGVALGGCPIASAASMASFSWWSKAGNPGKALDALYVRREAKEHGLGVKSLVEGPPSARTKPIVVVEDAVTTGASSIRAVRALVAEGFRVVGVVAVFARDYDASHAAIAEEGVSFDAIMDVSHI